MNWFKRFQPKPPPSEIFILEFFDVNLSRWIVYDKGFLTDADARQFTAERCAKQPLTWDVIIGQSGNYALSNYFVKPGYDISRFRISRITIVAWQARK